MFDRKGERIGAYDNNINKINFLYVFGVFPRTNTLLIENEKVLPALIVINEFKEQRQLPLTYWNYDDYQKSWRKSLRRACVTRVLQL